MRLKTIFKQVGTFLERESPSILTGISVAGVVSTSILAFKAAPEVAFLIEKERYATKDIPMSFRDKVKITWKCFIPSGISGGLTIAAIIMSNHVSSTRHAALAGAYSILEVGLHEYQDKIVETIGKRKEERVRDDILQDRLNANPVESNEIILTGRGEYLFYDSLSGRYFLSDVEKIRKVQNEFNNDLLTEMYKVLNDFYHEIGLEVTEMGRDMGWNVDDGLLDVRFVARLSTLGEPCVALEYSTKPRFL